MKPLKIVMLTTYYYPHISGLTLYFQRLAEEYVKLGHQVTMLTARHDRDLPGHEVVNGVEVIRSPYLFKLNKGLFLHRIIFDALRPLKEADVVHFNLPSIEALPVALLAKLMRKPIVTTYVCDITLPQFLGSSVLDKLIDLINHATLKLSNRIASFTLDFASESRLLRKYSQEQIYELYPIVEVKAALDNLPQLTKITSKPKIGMATRMSADKGIHVLLEAMPLLLRSFPDLKLVFVGNENAVGEEKYRNSLEPYFIKYQKHIIRLGQLDPDQMPAYFRELDLLVVASNNSTEAFGMVQVEAMLEGTPIVATDLPGVRMPIKHTGMGEIAAIDDSKDLARKISLVLSNPERYRKPPEEIRAIFAKDKIVSANLDFYQSAIGRQLT